MKLVRVSGINLQMDSIMMVELLKGGESTLYPILPVTESHYIGAFLSTFQLAPISPDGLVYNYLSDYSINIREGHEAEDISNSVADLYRVPTGIDNSVGDLRPKAFRYKGIVAIENNELIDSINIYVNTQSGIVLGAKVEEIEPTDRLILILSEEIDLDGLHQRSLNPHNFSKNYLDQGTINSFDTLGVRERLGNKVPHYDGILSAFCIHPADESVKIDRYIDIIEYNPNTNTVRYAWRYIENTYSNPRLPAFNE